MYIPCWAADVAISLAQTRRAVVARLNILQRVNVRRGNTIAVPCVTEHSQRTGWLNPVPSVSRATAVISAPYLRIGKRTAAGGLGACNGGRAHKNERASPGERELVKKNSNPPARVDTRPLPSLGLRGLPAGLVRGERAPFRPPSPHTTTPACGGGGWGGTATYYQLQAVELLEHICWSTSAAAACGCVPRRSNGHDGGLTMLCISLLRCNNGSEMYSLACPLLLGSGSSRSCGSKVPGTDLPRGEDGPTRRAGCCGVLDMFSR